MRAVSIPVIGCGGIRTADDVLEFLVVGCHAVQVGTANFSDPSLMIELVARMNAHLDDAGIERVTDCIGTLRTAESAAERPQEARQ